MRFCANRIWRSLLTELSPHAGEAQRNLPSRIFLEFQYPEIKDLLKHFLTLISGSLVFSVTFSEKIVGLDAAVPLKVLMSIAWLCLLAALGFCGVGLYTLYLTAEQARLSLATSEDADDFQVTARASYQFQDLAGISFGAGLFLLVLAGILRFLA
jgi:hypothetical protein